MKDIIDKLKIDLKTIKGIRQVFMHRDAKPTQYPAIICYLQSEDNTYETNKSNKKIANFNLYVALDANGKTMEELDEDIIPVIYDSVVRYFDENWNFGTDTGGGRMWSVLNLIESGLITEDTAKEAFLDFRLQIHYTRDNESADN